MNVRELIAELQKYDGDTKVSICDQEGFICEINWLEMKDTKKPYSYISADLKDQDQILELGN